ncbi:asparagine synthase-related protein [Sphingomonas sp. ASV193]|uniref:asparagine synthase-related protein n=1 Tax=Sphingomonas sp. ASV193 TaxID=3144405 RepID=UPI0032E913E2
MSFAVGFGSTRHLDALTADWIGRLAPLEWKVHRGEGMIVAVGPGETLIWSPDRRAVAVGLIVEARTCRPPAGLAPLPDEAKIADFVGNHWGRYILACASPDDCWLFRDPSGGQPAHHIRHADRHFIVPDIRTADLLGLDPGPVDHAFLGQWLTYPFLRTARTGYAGAAEILPGDVLCQSADGWRTKALWKPHRFVGPADRVLDFDEAARALGALLETVIPIMVGNAPSPVVQLSGGLDSAIVLAAMGKPGRSTVALTYHGPSADSDERRFARLSASAAHAGLHDFEIPASSPIAGPIGPRSFRPLPNAALRPLFGALDRHVRGLEGSALVDGAGGDNLFCFLTTAAPAVDAYRCRGMSQGCRTLDDLSVLTGSTLWTALLAAIRKQARARARPRWKRDDRFLKPEAVPTVPDRHPWLEVPEAILPGKREHIEALVSIQHFLDRGQPLLTVPMRHPLLAQPLLEFCLAVPTWLWCRGGRDRAVARAAMRARLPPEIEGRRTKGRLESLFRRAYRIQRPALRDMLLGGELAARGLIDEVAIMTYLLQSEDPADDGYIRLLEMAALEEWLRSAGR